MYELWYELAARPLANVIMAIASLPGSNLPVGIITLAIILRAAMYPISVAQMTTNLRIGQLRPQIEDVSKSHATKADKARSMQRIFRENRVGGSSYAGGLALQIAVMIAAMQAVHIAVGNNPDAAYASNMLVAVEAATAEATRWEQRHWTAIPMALICAAGMFVQQYLTRFPETLNERQRTTRRMTMLATPVFGAAICTILPAGMALYFTTAAIATAATARLVSNQALRRASY